MRMELPARTSEGFDLKDGQPKLPARKSQNSDISLETTERKLEIEPEKNLVKLAAEDSVPAGWKMEKFGSELDVLLTSPQVT